MPGTSRGSVREYRVKEYRDYTARLLDRVATLKARVAELEAALDLSRSEKAKARLEVVKAKSELMKSEHRYYLGLFYRRLVNATHFLDEGDESLRDWVKGGES